MYEQFRITGFFVGADAQYCAFEHPDVSLRGALEVKHVLSGEGNIADDHAYGLLILHCISKAFSLFPEQSLGAAASKFQLVVPFKPSVNTFDKHAMAAVFFDSGFEATIQDATIEVSCKRLYAVSEAFLCAIASSPESVSAIVINVGAWTTFAVPIYEGVAINRSVKYAKIGGELCTIAMEKMLDAKGLSSYSSQLPRRRRHIARAIKEKHAFVSQSFNQDVEKYGPFAFSLVQVMHDAAPSKSSKDSGATPAAAEIAIVVPIKDIDGTLENVVLDRELFYCSEVLFSDASDLIDDSYPVDKSLCSEKSIVDAILSTVASIEDVDMRQEICAKFVLTGSSCTMPGFIHRLSHADSLKRGLADLGVHHYEFLLASASDESLSGTMTGAAERLRDLQQNPNKMEGGCITVEDYEASGADCFNFVA
jgi:hypothetical protein